jgi:putative membrane protein
VVALTPPTPLDRACGVAARNSRGSLASSAVPLPTSVVNAVPQVVRGFAMGTADIVPGVSGGTVALVVGIYDRLIHNVHAGAQVLKEVLRGRLGDAGNRIREVEWVWLISLLVGILAAIAVLSSLLTRLLEEQPVRTSAMFLGLVAGAVVVAWRLLATIDITAIAMMLGSAAVLFFLLGLRTATESDADKVVTQPLWIFFLAGSIAICAMILPGISGSLILVMLGMYSEVLGAVTERDVAALGATALGCVVGLALFSTLLNWLLEHHHNLVIAAMIGLMIGSMRVLWPWPGGTATTEMSWPSGDVVIPALLVLAGFVIVIGVELAGQRLTKSESRAMPSARSASPSANENRA